MLREQPTKTEIYLGVWTSIQGAIFIGVSAVTLPVALHVAEILYAEDFDRSGGAPAWFSPWRLAMFHPYVVMGIFLLLGAILTTGGLLFAKRGHSALHCLERSLILSVICSLMLSVALIPLSNMGTDWGIGTLAYDLRLTLVSNTFAVWVDLVILLATLVIATRIRR